MMPPELAYAFAIGAFQNPSPELEPFLRGTVAHISAGESPQRNWRTSKQLQSAMDMNSMAENLQLTDVEQGDVIMDQKRAMTFQLQTGKSEGTIGYARLAAHYRGLKRAKKHPLGSERLPRPPPKVGTDFDTDLASHEALQRMEVRRGRDREFLHMSACKVEAIPAPTPPQYKHLVPEIIVTVAALVHREQLLRWLAKLRLWA